MAKEVMRRTASDNVYLHKDFHLNVSAGIEYVDQHYGEQAVRDYLRQVVNTFYAPLRADLVERGLVALKEYFERIYEIEGANMGATFSDDELIIEVEACPAVTYLREREYPVARLFYETTKTVNEALCAGTPFSAELLEYDEKTGQSKQRFYRRAS